MSSIDSFIKMWALAAVMGIFALGPEPSFAQLVEDETDVQMGRSSPESDDLLVESTPNKPHENVFIEDVEAGLKDIQEESSQTKKELKKTEAHLEHSRKKNYGDKKHQQKETLSALERKKKADTARLKLIRQRETHQKEILALEKKRIRAKKAAQESEESIEKAKVRLYEAKQKRYALGAPKRPPTSQKRYKKVKVRFGKDLSADAY